MDCCASRAIVSARSMSFFAEKMLCLVNSTVVSWRWLLIVDKFCPIRYPVSVRYVPWDCSTIVPPIPSAGTRRNWSSINWISMVPNSLKTLPSCFGLSQTTMESGASFGLQFSSSCLHCVIVKVW